MAQSKICTKCGIDKPLEEYHMDYRRNQRYSYCRKCRNKQTIEWSIKNKDHVNKLKRERRTGNEDYLEKEREYRKLQRNKYPERHKERDKKRNKIPARKEWVRQYSEDHKEERNIDRMGSDSKYNTWRRKYKKERLQNDIQFKLSYYLSNRIRSAIKNKIESSKELLGASIQIVIDHLERQFKSGMTWDNHGEWHIDHVFPVSSFDLSVKIQRMTCFNYKNLQPLWAKDNLRKSDNILFGG